ncbi:MAG: acetoacetate--CoA ligase, partial [Leptospiraceae bacterium]|nr:acetoacetate--CoA ligase [Leptospiraceae bacterium]
RQRQMCIRDRVDVLDDKGNSILEQEGELVCKNPFPSMPLYFWNDLDNSKYLNSYFEKFPNIWRHGDFAIHTENGGFIILGRSDATLNPGGVRIGTADIYKIVESILEIQDSLAVGQKWKGDERIVLFVKLREGFTLSDIVLEKIKLELKTKASPRHVPDVILSVDEIPYTRNMKKVELLVKNLLEGKPISNRDSLHNPWVIEYYQDLIQQHLKS